MKKQILKFLTGVVVLITLISSLSLNVFAADSLSINGTGSGNAGGGFNTNATGTGYSVQTIAYYSGYRFTYMDYYGAPYKTIDIINGSEWSDYSNRKTSTTKYNKKQLVDKYKSGSDFSIGLTATSNSTGVKDDGTYGLSYTVETASSDMTAWNTVTNVNKILKKMGYTYTGMTNSEQILVEPIIFCSIGGVKYALTLTEIWMVAGSQFGYSTCAKWGGAAGTYDNLGYRLNGTYPDNFYVDEENVICDVATALNPYFNSSKPGTGPSFKNLITKGYGLHLIYKGDGIQSPSYNITYNGNGGLYKGNETWLDTIRGPVEHGQGYTTWSNDNFFVRPGYTFVGWNEKKDGSGTDWTPWIGKEWKWTYTRDVTLYAQWKPNTLTINYYSNYANEAEGLSVEAYWGSTPKTWSTPVLQGVLRNASTYSYNESFDLPNIGNSYLKAYRDGYNATGYWYSTTTGEVVKADPDVTYTAAQLAEMYGKDLTAGNVTVNLYVQWESTAVNVDIDYVGNGATTGEDWTELVDLSGVDKYTLSADTDAFARVEEDEETGSKTLFKFMGWTIDDIFYDFGAEVPVDVLNKVAETVDGRDNKVVTVYATWDEYPVINAVDRWFSLDDALNGKITLEELMKTASAVDGEVGDVTDFEAGEGSFTIIDYDVEESGKFTTTGSVTITYRAIDKVGNETYRTVTVHIVDKDQQVGDIVTQYTRFISKKYFKDSEGAYLAESQGGFNLESVWINNPEYETLLTNVLNNTQNEETGEWDTVYQTFVFSIEDIANVKEYVETHGLGNSKEADALKNFYDLYKD